MGPCLWIHWSSVFTSSGSSLDGPMGWPFEHQLEHQLGGSTWQGYGRALQEAVYAPNQHPVCGALSSLVRTHWFRNQGAEMRDCSLLLP